MAMPGDTKAFNLYTNSIDPAGKMILMRGGIIDREDETRYCHLGVKLEIIGY